MQKITLNKKSNFVSKTEKYLEKFRPKLGPLTTIFQKLN